jgi:RHS repeat-associated protein
MRLGYERQLDEYRDEVYGTGHRSLYGRDEKLRFYHQYGRQVPDVGEPDHANDLQQEFRYDALGRRVMVRNLHRPFCDPQERDCTHAIERYIWDGDQLLWELRAPGDTSDNLEVQYTSGREYGRVAYVHGRGIDVPLGIARWNYVAGASFLLVPHLDWRGQWELGTDEDGERYPECGADPNCVRIGWPSTAVRSYMEKSGGEGEGDWLGSVLTDQRDPSGFLYRRNRYYDPMAGRFTQPDPIGLAGGINLYGFAGGDPANFADPFGLCPPGSRAWWCPGAILEGLKTAVTEGFNRAASWIGGLLPGVNAIAEASTGRSFSGEALSGRERGIRVVQATGEIALAAAPAGRVSSTLGRLSAKMDNLLPILDARHLELAAAELAAPGGRMGHVIEVRNAMRGARNWIRTADSVLANPYISDAERTQAARMLGQVRRALDEAEKIIS